MIFKPLEGVRVVDLTYFIAGPGTARILADWGADVIKVEPFFGDPCRKTGATMTMPVEKDFNPLFTTYNMNKRGMAIDLKSERGVEIMHDLLAKANVMVTSYRTGALKRLGLDYESLKDRHPHLIWAQVNGYGDEGPAKDKPGFDTISFWARSGTMIDIAEDQTSPINPPIGFGDATTSSSLAGGICAALYYQQKTGKGQKVNVALFAQALWNASSEIASVQFDDKYPKSRKNAISPVINSYKCKDGKWIFLSILEHERYFPQLCKVLGIEDLAQDERFITTGESKKNAVALIAELDKAFIQFTQDELVEKMVAEDIAHERIQHFEDVIKDAQAIDNKFIYEHTHRNSEKTYLSATPIKFGGVTDVNVKCDAPLVGEHSDEILREIGYDEDKIKTLLEDKIIVVNKL